MAVLVAINISSGGIPKLGVPKAEATETGLVGDGRAHSKHVKASRGISLLRKPCAVLAVADSTLKETTVGRIGWLARVVKPGWLVAGAAVELGRAEPA